MMRNPTPVARAILANSVCPSATQRGRGGGKGNEHGFQAANSNKGQSVFSAKRTLEVRLGALLHEVRRVLDELRQGLNEHRIHVTHGWFVDGGAGALQRSAIMLHRPEKKGGCGQS